MLEFNNEFPKLRLGFFLEVIVNMTFSRQRAMLHGMSAEEEKQLLQLPSGAKPLEMTEEMLEKKAEKAQKRRAQAHKKVEEHKVSSV